MHIVVAVDSFKGSLTSLQAGNAIRDAVISYNNGALVTVRPLADGGEGTVDALCAGAGGTMITIFVTGPRMALVEAQYCILEDGVTAVIEMASAAGLPLLSEQERDPMETTTYGVGEIITDAISRGCRRFIVGIGGSATNDGGTGMLSALGYNFLDAAGQPIQVGAKGLKHLASISTEKVIPELKECSFRIACDVDNPLCGERGCSAVYGPQKGATPENIEKMDRWLSGYARIAAEVSADADPAYPGSGAAGGLGFAFRTFLNAKLESGISIVLEETKLEQHIQAADLVITGEGRLDAQSVMGKAPIGVATLAKKYGKSVIAFAGCLGDGVERCYQHGIDAFYAIDRGEMSLADAMIPENAYKNLSDTAVKVFRTMNLGGKC